MEDNLKRLEPVDEYLSCRKLLERWSDVPQHRIMDAADGGALIPLRYGDEEFSPKIDRCRLPTVYIEEDQVTRIDVDSADLDGVMFSLANVLLLEAKYPKVFPKPAATERFDNPYDVINALMKRNEELRFKLDALRGRFEDVLGQYLDEMRDANYTLRHIDRLQTWLDEARADLVCADGDVQPCDGYGCPKWICEQRRKNVPDKDIMVELHEGFGHAQSAAAFMVKLPAEFKQELDAKASGTPVSNEARRGTYRSILTGINRERRKNGPEEAENDPL